ncbi:MAG TPA: hypothetical protein DDY31_18630 [Lachnospiraceae bacterium]|nr:hypothetical protein [Lachnospiraceae bacterium]
MNRILDKKPVNTSRQSEFDYLKGLFMVFIFFVHAYQATTSTEDIVEKIVFGFATLSGAAIFIFVMGMGTVYSKHSEPKTLAKSGIVMIGYQYLSNIAYIAALTLPYLFIRNGLDDKRVYHDLVMLYLQFINIFFITGIIYLALALAKKWKLSPAGYAAAGLLFAIAAPLIYGRPVDVPILGYIVKLVIGEDYFISFTAIYFLSYAFLGVSFGHLLQRVKDKKAFYALVMPICAVIALIWWGFTINKYGFGDELYAYLSTAYSEPDIFHVAASIAHVLFFAGALYFGDKVMKKSGVIGRQLLYYNRHISKYYAIHIAIYLAIFGFHKYEGFTPLQCWLITVLCMMLTGVIIRLYVSFIEKNNKTSKNV